MRSSPADRGRVVDDDNSDAGAPTSASITQTVITVNKVSRCRRERIRAKLNHTFGHHLLACTGKVGYEANERFLLRGILNFWETFLLENDNDYRFTDTRCITQFYLLFPF